MPIYQYECVKCKFISEILFFNIKNAKDRYICPKCYSRANKIISPSNFILKGDGWYKPESKKEEKDESVEGI